MSIRNFIYKCMVAIAIVIVFTFCSKEEETFDFSTPNNNILSGNIVMDMELGEDTFYLMGKTIVNSGVTLTINAGAVIKGVDKRLYRDNLAILIVEQGGKLNIKGTASNPVVFTSDTLKAGSWGGIIINGNAPVNKLSKSYGGFPYGGEEPDSNSGYVEYLRVEYAGDKNVSAFELNGLGNNTFVENVEVYKTKKNGFVFNGGMVNARHLISNGVGDRLFVWDKGWTGKGQFWVGYCNSDDIPDAKTDAKFVGFSGVDSDKNALTPISSPILSNITLIGNELASNLIMFNKSTQGFLYNTLLVDNAKPGVNARNYDVTKNVNNDLLVFDYVSLKNVKKWNSYHSSINDEKKFEKSENYIEEPIILQDVYVGTTENGKDMSEMDEWFESTSYKGAVASDNNWTEDWANPN